MSEKLQRMNVKYKTIFYPRHISVCLLQCEGENKRKNPLITSGGVLKNKCFNMLTCVEHTAATWAEPYIQYTCMYELQICKKITLFLTR